MDSPFPCRPVNHECRVKEKPDKKYRDNKKSRKNPRGNSPFKKSFKQFYSMIPFRFASVHTHIKVTHIIFFAVVSRIFQKYLQESRIYAQYDVRSVRCII